MGLLILACASLVAVYAQQPTPCQTPPQWQGKFARRDDMKNFTMYAEISYDATNRRVREVEYLEEGSTRMFYDVLYLHNVNKEYKIDLKNKNCTVGSLTRPFRPFGIPPEANYTGSANVGPVNIPDEHATIVLFEGRNERGDSISTVKSQHLIVSLLPMVSTVTKPDTNTQTSSISLAESQIQLFSSPHKDASLCRIKQPRDNAYFNSPLVVFI